MPVLLISFYLYDLQLPGCQVGTICIWARCWECYKQIIFRNWLQLASKVCRR